MDLIQHCQDVCRRLHSHGDSSECRQHQNDRGRTLDLWSTCNAACFFVSLACVIAKLVGSNGSELVNLMVRRHV
jgi:hypothetical protein